MRSQTYIVFLFFFLLGIGVLNVLASELHIYWLFPWSDTVMHFLGGFWAGALGVWLFFIRGGKRALEGTGEANTLARARVVLWTALLVGLLVGVLLEGFELLITLFLTYQRIDVFNTWRDVFFDGLGAVFFAVVYLFLRRRKKE